MKKLSALALALLMVLTLTPIEAEESTGWVKEDGIYYLYENGQKKTGWYKDSMNCWYYLDYKTGAMKTGWAADGDKWYWLNPFNGIMQTGWQTINEKQYFFKDSGEMVTGNVRLLDNLYTFANDGSLLRTEKYDLICNIDAAIDEAYNLNGYIDQLTTFFHDDLKETARNIKKEKYIEYVYEQIDGMYNQFESLSYADDTCFKEAYNDARLYVVDIKTWFDEFVETKKLPKYFPEFNVDILNQMLTTIDYLLGDLNTNSENTVEFIKNQTEWYQEVYADYKKFVK